MFVLYMYISFQFLPLFLSTPFFSMIFDHTNKKVFFANLFIRVLPFFQERLELTQTVTNIFRF